ncbi:hypothetical protein B296_00031017, partial [Ensete ventricosum]
WEKYDAKGWTEKGAHKYGRLNEQSWWEKWGEHYDGRGFVLKWFDCWSRTWGEEHFGNGYLLHYLSPSSLLWTHHLSSFFMNRSYVRAEPHYGWAEVVGDSTQLLSIQPQERPPGVYPSLDFGASEPQKDDPPDEPLRQ